MELITLWNVVEPFVFAAVGGALASLNVFWRKERENKDRLNYKRLAKSAGIAGLVGLVAGGYSYWSGMDLSFSMEFVAGFLGLHLEYLVSGVQNKWF